MQPLHNRSLSRRCLARFQTASLATALALAAGGCTRGVTTVNIPPPPPVFQSTPDLNALAAAINRNDAVSELSTNSASVDVLSMPAVPKLSANLHLKREKRFRMRASIPIMMGTGIDLGSNAQEFWFEVPEGMTQTLYYARHDQYAARLDRAILPVDPSWMIEAIGLVHLDPATVLAGPVTRSDGRIEIRTALPTPAGTYQRVLLVEPSAGYVTHLFLYAPDSRLVAKSQASEHRYDADTGSVLPYRVKMELFPAVGPPLAMQLDVSTYAVNQLLSGDPQLFVMPTTTGNRIDLNQLSARNFSGLTPPAVAGGSDGTGSWLSGGGPSAYAAEATHGLPMRGLR